MALRPLSSVAEHNEQLEMVFLEVMSNRNYVIREMVAKTVFVML